MVFLDRSGRIRVYRKVMILSYEDVHFVVVILCCENNYRATFISFCDHCIIIAEFCFY